MQPAAPKRTLARATSPEKPSVRPVPLLLVVLLVLFVCGGTALAQEAEIGYEIDPRPEIYLTDFTWYHPNLRADGRLDPRGLACTQAQPRRAFGEITATDYLSSSGYYGEKYERFKRHGIDGIAYLVTHRIPDSFDGGNLVQVAPLAVAAGLDFFAYYDLFVTSVRESGLRLCFPGSPCPLAPGVRRVPTYNINARPVLYEQLRDDFTRIAEHLILPHMNGADAPGYRMLKDAEGRLVLDEEGLPRPVIALFIAREMSDVAGNRRRIGELMEELTQIYRGLGIGKPALVLDVIFWATPDSDSETDPYDPEIVEAFGDAAVAVTWYGFFDNYRAMAQFRISNDGERPPMEVWAKALHQRYFETREFLAEHQHPLMLWPGIQTQIDNRRRPGCAVPNAGEVVFHLRHLDEWRFMLDRARRNTFRPRLGGETPLQTVAIVANAGEWYETGGLDYTHLDPRTGECSLPYHWCTGLLDAVTEAFSERQP